MPDYIVEVAIDVRDAFAATGLDDRLRRSLERTVRADYPHQAAERAAKWVVEQLVLENGGRT